MIKTSIPQDATCPALVVHDLSAGYAGARSAVNQVGFTVQAGESVAVLGPNGAGKSTLFKAIVGLIPHTSGHISLHGEDCVTSHTMVGYVPQREAIDWSFPATVYDTVMMGRARHMGWMRWPRRVDRDAVIHALKRVSMVDFRERQIGQLSGGQRRRVFIARALAQETDVLLLDEPFAGVDAAAAEEIMHVLDALHADGVTIILATHDMRLAAERFDKMLLINRTVQGFGTREEVFTPEVLQGVYQGQFSIVTDGAQPVFLVDDDHLHR